MTFFKNLARQGIGSKYGYLFDGPGGLRLPVKLKGGPSVELFWMEVKSEGELKNRSVAFETSFVIVAGAGRWICPEKWDGEFQQDTWVFFGKEGFAYAERIRKVRGIARAYWLETRLSAYRVALKIAKGSGVNVLFLNIKKKDIEGLT